MSEPSWRERFTAVAQQLDDALTRADAEGRDFGAPVTKPCELKVIGQNSVLITQCLAQVPSAFFKRLAERYIWNWQSNDRLGEN